MNGKKAKRLRREARAAAIGGADYKATYKALKKANR